MRLMGLLTTGRREDEQQHWSQDTDEGRLVKQDDALLAPGQRIADRKTFAKVFRRYYAPLSRYARRFTGDASAAADVLQDVFLKLWEDRSRLTVERSLQAMLYTMVRNRALNMNRRRQRMASDTAVDNLLDRPSAQVSSDHRLAAHDLQRHLHRWIEELPPRRREAFALSRYHGLSHAEIADVMGISERTVDTHIVHALRELRRRLDELQDKGTTP